MWESSDYLFFYCSLSKQPIPGVFPTVSSHLAEQIVFILRGAHISHVWGAPSHSQAGLFARYLCSCLLSLVRLSASHVLGTGCHIRRCHPDGLLMMCGAEEVGRRVGLCPASLSSASGDLCPSFQPGTPDEVFVLFKSQLIFLG